MNTHRLLIVHPDPSNCALIMSMLQSLGHRLDEVCNESAAMRSLEQAAFDLVITSANPADPDCLEFLNYVRRKYPKIPVIVVFPVHHHERQREAIHRGAATVLRFPLPATQLRATVAQTLGLPEPDSSASHWASSSPTVPDSRGSHEDPVVANPPNRPEPTRAFESRQPTPYGAIPHGTAATDNPAMIGDDRSLRHTIELAATIATCNVPLMILGEPGAGKSLLAQMIHSKALHNDRPIIEVNCASLREAVLEVDLFGRRASEAEDLNTRPGKILRARGGTIYFEEVSALSAPLQARLLRLLRTGEIVPVGSDQPIRVDVRVIASSSRNLTPLVENGLFRQDLLEMLSVITFRLPPLRQRTGDLETLAEHFRARFAREIGKAVVGFTPEAMESLRHHSWPGNVAELENVVERAVVLCRGSWIDVTHLDIQCRDGIEVRTVTIPAPAPSRTPSAATILPLKEALEGPEKQLILDALEALNWNRQETARMLDINRTTLYKKMKKYGLLFDEPIWAN